MKLTTTLFTPLLALSMSFLEPCLPSSQKGPPQPQPGEVIYEVITIYPRIEDRPRVVSASGTFSASANLTVRSSVEGVAEKVFVKEGDSVKEGDTLVSFASDEIKNEIEKKLAQLKEAQANLERDRKLAELNHGTIEPMHEKNSIPESVFLDEEGADKPVAEKPMGVPDPQIPPAREDWQSRIQAGEARVETLTKEADALDAKLKQYAVTSPLSGIVKRSYLNEGGVAQQNGALFDIVTLDPVILTFGVPQDVSSYVDKHVRVQAGPVSAPEILADGSVTYVSPSIDPIKQTLEMKAQVSNPNGLIKEGQEGRALVTTRKTDKILIVPRDVLVREGDRSYLFIVQGPQAKKVEVKPGELMGAQEIAIEANLRIDDPIISSGQVNIKDASFVKIIKQNEALSSGESKQTVPPVSPSPSPSPPTSPGP